MKVAIYARVSDDKLQDDGSRRQDVQRQVEKLQSFSAVYFPGQEVQVFLDDGRSAFKEDYNSRPEFCRMLREIRARRIQRVLVESLDRWARRIEDGLKTLREVSEVGCTVTSAAEGECDITTPQGWFKVGVAFLMAEWASRNQSWKVTNGMERRRNDDRKKCHSCGIVHLGRHPQTCECPACRKRRGKPEKKGEGPNLSGIASVFGQPPKVNLPL
jgi:DNA invertase Pin-like site-specific DNA recombinase